MKITFTYDNTKFTVDADGYNYTPVKHGINQAMKDGVKGANYGKPTETTIGYYKSLGGAINAVIEQHESSKEEEITLKEYVARMESAKKEILNQVDLNLV